jgi:shikimate kinase / 3-dehydroquinate synthase
VEGQAVALVFIGFMGAGKTSAARAAAGMLDARAVDADHEIERRLGTTIADHFAASGEAAFRQVEEQVVSSLLERPPEPVLSLGGGAVLSPRVRELLRRHTVVLLDVDVETAWRRCGNKRRPPA